MQLKQRFYNLLTHALHITPHQANIHPVEEVAVVHG